MDDKLENPPPLYTVRKLQVQKTWRARRNPQAWTTYERTHNPRVKLRITIEQPEFH